MDTMENRQLQNCKKQYKQISAKDFWVDFIGFPFRFTVYKINKIYQKKCMVHVKFVVHVERIFCCFLEFLNRVCFKSFISAQLSLSHFADSEKPSEAYHVIFSIFFLSNSTKSPTRLQQAKLLIKPFRKSRVIHLENILNLNVECFAHESW